MHNKSPHLWEEYAILAPLFFSRYIPFLRHCFQKLTEEHLHPDLVFRLARRFDKLDSNQFAIWYHNFNIRMLPDEDNQEDIQIEKLQK